MDRNDVKRFVTGAEMKRKAALVLAISMLLCTPLTVLAGEQELPAAGQEAVQTEEMQTEEMQTEEMQKEYIPSESSQVDDSILPEKQAPSDVQEEELMPVTDGNAADDISETEIKQASESEAEETADVPDVSTEGFDQSREIDGVIIRITAAAGVFPAGAVLKVSKVTEKATLKEIDDAIEEEKGGKSFSGDNFAFDIKIMSDDSDSAVELLPDTAYGDVGVTFTFAGKADDGREIDVYHVKDAAEAVKTEPDLSDEDQEEFSDGSIINDLDSSEEKTDCAADSEGKTKEGTPSELIVEKMDTEVSNAGSAGGNKVRVTVKTDSFSIYVIKVTSGYYITGDSWRVTWMYIDGKKYSSDKKVTFFEVSGDNGSDKPIESRFDTITGPVDDIDEVISADLNTRHFLVVTKDGMIIKKTRAWRINDYENGIFVTFGIEDYLLKNIEKEDYITVRFFSGPATPSTASESEYTEYSRGSRSVDISKCPFTPPEGKRLSGWKLINIDTFDEWDLYPEQYSFDPRDYAGYGEELWLIAQWEDAGQIGLYLYNDLYTGSGKKIFVSSGASYTLPENHNGSDVAFYMSEACTWENGQLIVNGEIAYHAAGSQITPASDMVLTPYRTELGITLENEKPVYYESGSKISDRMIQIGGYWFYFSPDGVMSVKCRTCIDTDTMTAVANPETPDMERDRWIFTDSDGICIRGQSKIINGKRYLFGYDCFMIYGFVYGVEPVPATSSEEKYYYDYNKGLIINDWIEVDGRTYRSYEDGMIICNSIEEIDGETYVFAASGERLEDFVFFKGEEGKKRQEVNLAQDTPYTYLQPSGKLLRNGSVEIDGKIFDADEDGYLTPGKAGWVEVDGKWKYRDQNGYYCKNCWRKSGDNWYWLGADGYMVTESLIKMPEGDIYYVNDQGRMVKNIWVYVNDPEENNHFFWFYFGDDGRAFKSSIRNIAGQKYCFDDKAHMLVGWIDFQGGRYYAFAKGEAVDHDEGQLICSAWLTKDGYRYYFDADGRLVKSEPVSGGRSNSGGSSSGGGGGGSTGMNAGAAAAGGPAAGGATYSSNWFADAKGAWKIKNSKGEIVANAWLCDDIISANGQNVWYLLKDDGTMLTAGLVQDKTGNFYSLETGHNGYFGMMRYKDGFYDCNGQQVYLQFSQKHDGSFGAVINADGIEKLKAIYGVTQYGIGNDSCTYTASF